MSKRVNRNFRRRRFLQGLGVSAAVAPFVPRLDREAVAQSEGPVKRLILFYTPDGTIDDAWKPTGSTNDFQLSPILSPLQAFQEQLIVLHGLEMTQAGPGGAHYRGMAALWSGSRLNSGGEFQGDGFTTGWGSGKTIDQAVAEGMDTSTLPFASLEFGVQCKNAHPRNRMIYTGDSQPVPPESDPAAMFQRLFADIGIDPELAAKVKAQRLSIIDVVKDELATLQPKYGTDDAIKVEKHLDAIRDIEDRLKLEAPTCEPPLDPGEMAFDNNANFPEVGALQMEMLVDALACDLTRVASIQFSKATTTVTHSWLGHNDPHHGISHGTHANKDELITEVHTWYAERFADFLGLLDSVPEPDGEGTLLSNSIVVWGQELSTPNHGLANQPFVIAGGGGGVLETGRFLQYGNEGHHRLLISIGRAMGLNIDSFGNLDEGEGPLAELGV